LESGVERSYRMNANDGVLGFHRFSADEFPIPTCALCLRETRMLGSQAFQELLDGIRETIVSSYLRNPTRISSGAGNSKECKNGDSRGLVLVADIRVVASGSEL
jgi:hypothetical protein